MAAGKYSFTIEQGSTVDFELRYKDADGNPINLQGHRSKMQIKSGYADNNPTTYLTLSSSILSDRTGLNLSGSSGDTPLTSGSIGLYISAATSSLLSFDTAYYDIVITSGSTITRILEGQIKLAKQVTR